MDTVLYADVLFIVNLSMDFLTIYIAAKLTHAKLSTLKVLAASAIGALYGVSAVIFIGSSVLSVFGNAVVSAVLAFVAFGFSGGFPELLRQSAVIWGCGALLGGIMSALMALGEPIYLDNGHSEAYSRYYILTFAAAVLFIRIFTGRSDRKTVEVELCADGETVRFTALVDSGNLIREPLSGSPVIVASSSLFGEKTVEQIESIRNSDGKAEPSVKMRVRVIPQKTINGAGLLYGFVPDEVKVGGKTKNAVIALDESPGADYGGFSGIVPACLCR